MKPLTFPIQRFEDLFEEDELDLLTRNDSVAEFLINDRSWALVAQLTGEWWKRRKQIQEERRKVRRQRKSMRTMTARARR